MREFLLALLAASSFAFAADGNRLVYLDESDPYYVSRTFPKLTTPQWIGEEGVEAVIVLAVDDMREAPRYETFLRPILERLKKIDGRAPVSIMTNRIDPTLPKLQEWLKEGLSIDIHTIDHPCPLFNGGDFAKAKSTYDRCVELVNAIPGNRPVAFRMPCCDSLNTPSPRFWEEIFNKTTEHGRFLTMDSSVFNITTPNDPSLPRELVIDADGRQKFKKFVPFESFVNTIEDYPYPYIIGKLCWEMPCVTPSDWQAQNINKPMNPSTVADMKSAIDVTVLKQGGFFFVFHPHGWIGSNQVVELIDHAVAKHGKNVKFLSFRECQERIDKNMLGGHPLRAENGTDNGVRLIDLNDDGFIDVVIGNEKVKQTRIWSPKTNSWVAGDFPVAIDGKTRFGLVSSSGNVSVLKPDAAFTFDGEKWVEDGTLLAGLDGVPFEAVRLRDLNKDGRCELIIGSPTQSAVFEYHPSEHRWIKRAYGLPEGTSIVDAQGRDAGLRFVDVDENGFEDVLFSNGKTSSLHLFVSPQKGWEKKVDAGAIPAIVRDGTNNGAWFHSRGLWVVNENTDKLPNLVERKSFNEMLGKTEPAARSPGASLKSIRVRPGFIVQQMAAEPLTMDPVAFNWGADGKLWVAEMGDYPNGLDGKGAPGGRVRILEDTDGDGIYDKSTLFIDGLNYANGVLPWRKGALITAAPDIIYAEDTDGDGKADKREALYTGFGPGNPQHRANGLVLGLDNWIYCANGDSGGRIKSTKTGAQVNISGRDFRIKPDEGLIEAETGQTQFGRCQDDWGNWFGCNNPNPMYHFVLSDRYLRRNSRLAPPRPVVMVPKVPTAAPVFPISRTMARFNDPEMFNRFTSANSVMIYRDALFGPHFAGNMFVSEPVHNLVHREVMTPSGVTFTSDRAIDELKSDFLASSDNWFRPTTLRTGPDGALWIADMYRQVIEHPEWIPVGTKAKMNLRLGDDKGRIYRVYPVGANPRPIPRLDQLDTAILVTALDNPSGWQRDTAQRLLVARQDAKAIPLLREMALKNARPLARLHALCALDGLNAADSSILLAALGDAHPGIRRHAVRIAESQFNKLPELAAAAAKLVDDPDPQVRLQLASSLGEWDLPDAGVALGKLALKDANERFALAAIFSSVTEKNLNALATTVMSASKGTPPPSLLEPLIHMASAYGDTKLIGQFLSAIATGPKDSQFAALAGFLDSLEANNTSLIKLDQRGAGDIFDAARKVAADANAPLQQRINAVRLLGRGSDKKADDLALLAKVLVPQIPVEIQSAAIATLARSRHDGVPSILLSRWKNLSLILRSQAADVLLARNEWIDPLLGALEAGKILPADIDAARRQRLLQHRNGGIRARAEKIFADAINPDRQKVLDAYSTAITMTGDAKHGAEVFTKACSTCHKLGEIGQHVGPDLRSVGDKSPQSLLIAIIDPNRAVEARYTNYVAETKRDDVATGIITSETGTSITLITADGKPQIILRDNLKSLRSTGTSLMPENLESGYSPQDLADVIAFVRAANPPTPKKFDGNRPEIVRAVGNNVLKLTPANCEIYGTTVVLEKQYGNLGYWSSEDDQAIWTVDVPAAAKYGVWLEWACAEESAGNSFILEIGPRRLSGRVASTGNWDTYHRLMLQEIELQPGKQQVTFRSAGKISGALIDLKSIELVPPMKRDFK
jgi:putative membrane-bound dehydrogenase-like protein